MKIEQIRENVFTVTAASYELSALVAAARMALDAMQDDPRAPAEVVRILERVLAEYDAALKRAQ